MKRIAFLLCLALCFIMAGCGHDEESVKDTGAPEYIVEPALVGISGDSYSVDIPADISDKNDPFKGKDDVAYESEDGAVKYILIPNKDEQSNIMSYGWSIVINNESAGDAFRYKFDPNVDFRVESNDGKKDKIVGEIVFLDPDGNEINSLSKPDAHDADGKKVESYYIIDGKDVIQKIVLDDAKLPITIE